MSAGIYAARGKMKTLIIEQKRKTGGQCATTTELENYPGYLETTGPDLMDTFRNHCDKFGVEFITGQIEDLDLKGGFIKTVTLKDGSKIQGKSIIVATGAEPRILGIKGEREFRGKGVSYCATCDADFYEDLDIVVVGSGNTAVEESIYLTKFVNSIKMVVIHKEGVLDADKVAQEHAFKNEKIDFIWNSVVDEICGKDLVNAVKVKNITTGEITEVPCDGVFMFVGTVPQTGFLKDKVDLTPQGYIKAGRKQETSAGGVFAAGDVVDKYLRQVVTAAADGSIAAVAASGYIDEEESWQEKVMENKGRAAALFWSPIQKDGVSVMNALEAEAKGKDITLTNIDTYKNQFIAERYDVKEIPTVIVFEGGKETARKVKPSADDLKELLK